jgi:hypothetical protein
MADDSANEHSLATGAGCLLIAMGGITAVFGLAALFGLSDRIELRFFGLELNDRAGQAMWVGGGIIAMTVGALLLRMGRDD